MRFFWICCQWCMKFSNSLYLIFDLAINRYQDSRPFPVHVSQILKKNTPRDKIYTESTLFCPNFEKRFLRAQKELWAHLWTRIWSRSIFWRSDVDFWKSDVDFGFWVWSQPANDQISKQNSNCSFSGLRRKLSVEILSACSPGSIFWKSYVEFEKSDVDFGLLTLFQWSTSFGPFSKCRKSWA